MSTVGSILITLALTIMTESAVAYITGVRGLRQYVVVLAMNVLTNPLLNITLKMLDLRGLWFYIAVLTGETIVVLMEGAILALFCGFLSLKPYRLSLILNISSFMAGLLWAAFI